MVTSTPAEEVDAAEVAEEAKNGDAGKNYFCIMTLNMQITFRVCVCVCVCASFSNNYDYDQIGHSISEGQQQFNEADSILAPYITLSRNG